MDKASRWATLVVFLVIAGCCGLLILGASCVPGRTPASELSRP